MTMKLRKGDKVRVLTGKDRGKEGEITRAIPAEAKVIVDGVNVAKKHQRPVRATMQAGIIDRDMPVPVANVALVCPSCGRASRVGYRIEAQGAKAAVGTGRAGKVRVCRRCGAEVPSRGRAGNV